MPRISANGLNFYYQQTGSGPDVVLLHGVSGNMAIWPLINLTRTLATDFRVTAYDLRGHGYSDTPPSGYTSADMAEDLVHIKEALGLDRVFVLGHSFGGVVALHAAVLHPGSIQGLILSDPYFPGLRHLETGMGSWSGWQDYRAQARRAGLEVSEDHWFDVGQLFEQAAQLSGEQRQAFLNELGPAALDRLTRLAATTCRQDIKEVAGLTAEAIASVQHPVVALYGEKSPFLSTCRYLQEKLAHCSVALVPGAEHRAHEENPIAYVALVQQHLRTMAGITMPEEVAT